MRISSGFIVTPARGASARQARPSRGPEAGVAQRRAQSGCSARSVSLGWPGASGQTILVEGFGPSGRTKEALPVRSGAGSPGRDARPSRSGRRGLARTASYPRLEDRRWKRAGQAAAQYRCGAVSAAQGSGGAQTALPGRDRVAPCKQGRLRHRRSRRRRTRAGSSIGCPSFR